MFIAICDNLLLTTFIVKIMCFFSCFRNTLLINTSSFGSWIIVNDNISICLFYIYQDKEDHNKRQVLFFNLIGRKTIWKLLKLFRITYNDEDRQLVE